MRIQLVEPHMDKHYSVQFRFRKGEGKELIYEFFASRECKAVNGFLQSDCDDFVMIEFWADNLGDIIAAAEKAGEILELEVGGLKGFKEKQDLVLVIHSNDWEKVMDLFFVGGELAPEVLGIKTGWCQPYNVYVQSLEDKLIFLDLLQAAGVRILG